MSAIDRAHSLVGDNKIGRPADDFYPTPESATLALMNSILLSSNRIWEPACGDGAISRVLENTGLDVISTDLFDHGYGQVGVDFLQTTELLAPVIITNPPFSLAEQFLKHALGLGARQVYLLGKLAFLEGDKRARYLETTPFSRVMVFRKRITLTRNGVKMANSGMIAFAWYEWIVGYFGKPEVTWL